MKAVNTMQKYVALFFTLLAGNIVGHYICKWLDRRHEQ